MNVTLRPGARHGTVRVPASKSVAHRALICAALGAGETAVCCRGSGGDVAATADCLRALGAGIEADGDTLRVTPLRAAPKGVVTLPCGESGSTLRFLLPVAGALGASTVFRREGRLPERPIDALAAALRAHGMKIWESGANICCEGKLLAGNYTICGDVSSQFVSGLLLALPLLAGESTLRVTGAAVSAPYTALTEDVLRVAGIGLEKSDNCYKISGGQRFAPPAEWSVEGDWSAAAAFLCMGALSSEGVAAEGLAPDSRQGDRAVLDALRAFGACVELRGSAALARRGALRGCVVDAAQTPDLVPVLAALAACAEGETRIVNAARLRDKESDRLQTTAAMLRALGADAEETADGLRIRGGRPLSGGTADAANDHRVAMAAAVAACACDGDVLVRGAECVAKSYPAFWEELSCLSM